MKIYDFRLRFHWNLFLALGSINNIPALVQVMNGLAPARRQVIVLNNDG